MSISKKALGVYFIATHLVLGVAILKTDLLEKAARVMGVNALSSEQTPHYHNMFTSHLRMDGNIPDGSVIFIGNSLTQSLVTTAIVNPSVNYGIGTDTTAGILKRIENYESLKRARAVVLSIGINDFRYRTNEEILGNIQAISARIPEHVPIIFSAVLPVSEQLARISNQRIREYNELLEGFAGTQGHYYFVNPGENLLDGEGELATEYHVGDGKHLNSYGNAVWINELRKALTDAGIYGVVEV